MPVLQRLSRPGISRIVVLIGAALSLLSLPAGAQLNWHPADPCQANLSAFPVWPEVQELLRSIPFDLLSRPIPTNGLSPAGLGTMVYDSGQGLCWLADANLAGNPEVRALMGVANINPDGTMDYPTALLWVNALNNFAGGRGFLGHKNWQLPQTPMTDNTCTSVNNASFATSCTGSALGYLYQTGLTRTFPTSVVPNFRGVVSPFQDMQPGLYWTADPSPDGNVNGQVTISFNDGDNGSNTVKYNYFHVLPVSVDPIGTPPTGTGILPYTSGPAAGKAVFDTANNLTWVLDANLAAHSNFGVVGNASITSNTNGTTLNPPLINSSGAMLYSTVIAPCVPLVSNSCGWIAAMNQANYAGAKDWALPTLNQLNHLYNHLNLTVGTPALEALGSVGPFWRLQPGFYWACQRDDPGNRQSPCDLSLPPLYPGQEIPLPWSFNFDEGFQGTDLPGKHFYVMVYYPAP